MFIMTPPDDEPDYNVPINRVLTSMGGHEPDSEEFGKMVKQLKELTEMKVKSRPDYVSLDTLMTVGANLLGILLILHHEEANVITTKALGFVKRLM